MKNIVLTGMPGAGKSTLGVLLSKTLGMSFLDTDLLIQNNERMLLHEIIKQRGLATFLAIEETALCAIRAKNTVIATGGSAVMSEAAMEHLRHDAIVVFLDVPIALIERRIKNIRTRGIAMENRESLRDVYARRLPLYAQYADIRVRFPAEEGDMEASLALILKELASYQARASRGGDPALR